MLETILILLFAPLLLGLGYLALQLVIGLLVVSWSFVFALFRGDI